MEVRIEDGFLIIKLPLEKEPKLSSSKKTMVVATTGGNVLTTAIVAGKQISVGATAYIKK